MNPLTLVKRIQNITAKEASLGISDDASWHAKYKDSAYVYIGGIPYDLTEGDLLAVFAQYGEIVDVNLVRDKGTGKSKGFAFVAYEDQRSTILAVDNLNGAQVLGRTIRVDHVTKYKKKEEEDEETEQRKREERGVCRAFQKASALVAQDVNFHMMNRAANTGWGHEEDRRSKRGHDKFEGSKPKVAQSGLSNRFPESSQEGRNLKKDRDERNESRGGGGSIRHVDKSNSREYRRDDRRDEKRWRKKESESYSRDYMGKEKSSGRFMDSSP